MEKASYVVGSASCNSMVPFVLCPDVDFRFSRHRHANWLFYSISSVQLVPGSRRMQTDVVLTLISLLFLV